MHDELLCFISLKCKPVCFSLAGHHSAAVAHVEAEDAEDRFVK